MAGKYDAQQKYMRKTYVRFPLDLRPEVLAAFREACETFVAGIGRRPAGSYPLHYGIQRRRCSGREDGKQS